ncbi:sulfite exporter TauE/SafE family protein [Acinetobacter sp. ANC 3791]|uniref:sulfite exporter TauE/SafE family protein n=1 Tax=Acinetobacter sp. ANC 3791 TaxID=2529836 RepID=UPI00103890D8|nr:sulfite exporter TauE/SafE family protein [Acinetobacter sp. ANC 3791]TCB83444.1 sulfite exporter TauE/SafE family protein [Acinetobacter sp. ANC 3791]
MWILVVEGLAIGCLLGLTGAGGGILAVPALMASQGWTVAQAAPVGLLAVTFSTFIGTLQGLFKKIVRYRAALWIAFVGIPASHLGIWASQHTSPMWLSLLFALVMFVVAYRLFSHPHEDFHNPPCRINPYTGKLQWDIPTALILGGIGIIAGFLTGLLGVGGGFVIVPALKKTTNLDLHSIVATSLMIIFLVGGLSIGLHVLDGFVYPTAVTLVFAGACIVGLLVGRQIVTRISTHYVQRIFAITVILVAVLMLVKSLKAIFAL